MTAQGDVKIGIRDQAVGTEQCAFAADHLFCSGDRNAADATVLFQNDARSGGDTAECRSSIV